MTLTCRLLFFLTLTTFSLQAQVRLVPVGHASPSTNHVNARQSGTQALDTVLSLPFWDDFSQIAQDTLGFPTPDTLRWTPQSNNVRINTGLAINPPSVGVASFDGVDSVGRPYNPTGAEGVLSDSLESRPINLAIVPETERNTVYLSFFWQQQGLGEFPDVLQGDFLRLQFKNDENTWITKWIQTGDTTMATDMFTQVVVAVDSSQYFHERFQFRFQSANRQSGTFDTWNVDYVYLDKNREDVANPAYPDRALTTLPTSLLGEYTAVPMTQFKADPTRYISPPTVGLYNLDVGPVGVRFSALVRDAVSGTLIDSLNNLSVFSDLVLARERATIVAEPLEVSALNLEADSLLLETEFYIVTGDNFLIRSFAPDGTPVYDSAVNFRVNDTVRTTFELNQTLAYDDGEAESALEINQSGSRVAYRFFTPIEDILTHINVYFPNLDQNGSARISLLVWKSIQDSLGNDQQVLLREPQPVTVTPVGTYNGFISYELSSPVVVSDTFYIGYEQSSAAPFAAIGFDKNTDTSDKIFFNVSGNWTQNPRLRGSMMMRPRFDPQRAEIITDLPPPLPEEQAAEELTVFPNPSDGVLHIQGTFDQLRILDLLGREVWHTDRFQADVDLSGQYPGLYIFRFTIDGQTVTRKVILR